ncbi:MarR family winged helix-turn-helix transcriptional regulator [Sphingomonas dokdonensis]|uniref:MarR family winged helix-turn-helix transcriptional regulator n=1 Tax=Sphingomonas dokdonensis TaxID=344880 RepID=UPI001FEC66E8|nr:MarR family transcriptional regulator [Sphingomonas dokdonensis]
MADSVLAEFSISNSSGWCLTHLSRLGPDTRQRELAEAIGITPASLTRTLADLDRRGLVARQADQGDRRANHVRLTDAGVALAQQIEARLTALRAELLEGLPEADIALMVSMLDHIAGRIEQRRLRA